MDIHQLRKIRVELQKEIEPPMVPALVVDEKFIIPVPEKGESQNDYVSRCMDAIGNEYDTPEQGVAVCIATYEKK